MTAVPAWNSLSPSVAQVRSNLGLGPADPHIDVKLMASLLSMDAYIVLPGLQGKETNRTVQQWLNSTYSHRRNFALIPTDGVVSRQAQTALLYALQFELGMTDDTATGNFGPGTRAGIKEKAIVSYGDVDSANNFVQLYQGCLRFAGYYPAMDGDFGENTRYTTLSFQKSLELAETGNGDYGLIGFLGGGRRR